LGSTPHKGPLVPALHQYLDPSKQDTSTCLLDCCKMYCSVYVKSRRAYGSPTVDALLQLVFSAIRGSRLLVDR
jgi:hypothetical protein